MMPTEAALKLRFPFLMLDSDDAKNRALWKQFDELDGMAYLGGVRQGSTELAVGSNKVPILVGGEPGGRVLVFGGDTTWKAWRGTPDAAAAFDRFWKHTFLWLAHQDQAGGDLWVKLDRRSVQAASPGRVYFSFGLHGKSGLDAKDASYTYKVLGPDGTPVNLPVGVENPGRASIPSPSAPGEYRLQVAGKGADPAGGEVAGTRTARFVVTSEDVEKLHTAANHALLLQIATASGGQFFPADERLLLNYLAELKGQTRSETHARAVRWPDWQQLPASEQWPDQLRALWQSSALVCVLAFVGPPRLRMAPASAVGVGVNAHRVG